MGGAQDGLCMQNDKACTDRLAELGLSVASATTGCSVGYTAARFIVSYTRVCIMSILLAAQSETATSIPLGLEWMPVASILVPAVLLAVIIYLGSSQSVH